MTEMRAHGVGSRWRRLPDALLAVLLASRCAACDALLDEPTRGAVCPACWLRVRSFSPPLCEQCGDPLPSWRTISRQQRRCARCRRCPRPVDHSRAVGPYDGALRQILHAFKYEGRRSLAAPLAAMMRRQAAELIRDTDCVVPVPLHWTRRRARGFNQAADLARRLGPPVVELLRRSSRTVSQTDLPAARRHTNVRGAFVLARRPWWGRVRSALSHARILLVDDVSTTGATLDACAHVLKAHGARDVSALTAARVVTRRP